MYMPNTGANSWPTKYENFWTGTKENGNWICLLLLSAVLMIISKEPQVIHRCDAQGGWGVGMRSGWGWGWGGVVRVKDQEKQCHVVEAGGGGRRGVRRGEEEGGQNVESQLFQWHVALVWHNILLGVDILSYPCHKTHMKYLSCWSILLWHNICPTEQSLWY